MEDKKPTLVAWSTVCRTKNQGGLGLLQINAQNNALLLKNLHKLFNRHDMPWIKLVWEAYYSNGQIPGNQMVGSFWWKANTALLDQYKSMARCTIGNGSSASFWFDLWNTQCLHSQLPHIFSFAKNHLISVKEFMATEYMEDLFQLPCQLKIFRNFRSFTYFAKNLIRAAIPITMINGATFGEAISSAHPNLTVL